METLQSEHIAPYLPNLIKVKFHSNRIEEVYGMTNTQLFIYGMGWIEISECKPLLIPCSELKSQTLPGWSICPAFIMRDEFNYDIISSYGYAHVKPESYPYRITKLLFQWHFDVFGLIEQGLAIDKTLTPPTL